jgi:Cysteine rich repeat
MVRRLTFASLFSLAVVSLAGSALAQTEAMALCKSDAARLCPGVQPGGGRIIGCLKAHQKEMSVGCAQALQKMKAKMGQ